MSDFPSQGSHVDLRVGLFKENWIPDTWHKVPFSPPFPNNVKVVVYLGDETAGMRVRNVNQASFEICMEDGSLKKFDPNHSDLVGWAAYGFPE